ncbi:MAG: protein translocase subunit SecF [Acidimicrobiales bacterium]
MSPDERDEGVPGPGDEVGADPAPDEGATVRGGSALDRVAASGTGPTEGFTEEELEEAGLSPAELGEEFQEELVEDEEAREEVRAEVEAGKGPGPISRLYHGETSFDFVGRRRVWFTISAAIIVAGLLSLGIRGLNLGIDFKGGTAWIVKTSTLSQTQAENLVSAAGLNQPIVEVLGSGSHRTIEVQADLNNLTHTQREKISSAVVAALAKGAHVPASEVSTTHVGPTWGSQVTHRAILALIVFFIVVAIYISIRFEPKMALAAFIAMIHDILVTIGIYSLAGFQVTPDTVIALLTILGYSLYDTVVVFDRIRDNTKGFGASGRMTYSEMINLSMNQTLARSINTSLVAILPVLSVLVIGAEILGATTLQQYGLALTVGLLSGAYSSIFIASPVLAMLKEREPRYAAIRQRLESRGERVGLLTPAAAALAVAGGGTVRAGKSGGNGSRSTAPLRPGSSRKPQPVTATASKGASSSGGASSATRSQTAASGASGGGGNRPPPRPRKGGGKGKSKKRR